MDRLTTSSGKRSGVVFLVVDEQRRAQAWREPEQLPSVLGHHRFGEVGQLCAGDDEIDTPVNAAPDLVITKDDGQVTVQPNGTVTYSGTMGTDVSAETMFGLSCCAVVAGNQ